MKKLIIGAFAVVLAMATQAATVSWGSGALYTAASSTGGWSSTLVNNADPKVVVTMSVFLTDATTYATLTAAGKTAADLYEWASGQTASYTGQNKNPSTGTVIGAATISVADTLAASTTYYSIITAEYTDSTYGDMYMATARTITTTSAGAGSATTLFGGAGTAATGGVRNWTAVPEPTSGLLMLLGMAGLALRRRRA